MARNGIYLARAREQIAQQRAENEREHRRRVDDAYRRVPGLRTLDQTLQMVLSGRADATLNAEVSFYDYMNAHPEANLKVVAPTEEASQVAIPLRKGEESATLLAAVNEAIDALRAEGELTRISEKYFGKDISMPTAENE